MFNLHLPVAWMLWDTLYEMGKDGKLIRNPSTEATC